MNSVKKNFIYNVAFQILNLILPLITTPYISRVLGPNGVGKYSYAYSVAYYFVIFILLGLNNYGNREIASSRNDIISVSKNFSNIYITQFLLGLAVTVVYFVYCIAFSSDVISALILGIYVISGIFDINWFFYGLEQFKLTVIRNTVIKFLSLAMIFIFVKDQNDVYIYCLILASSYLLSQLSIWPFLLKEIEFIHPNRADALRHLRGSLILFISVIAVSLFKVMDKIMLGIMSDYSQVGFYESSEKLINIPMAFVTALGTVMLPRMTYLVANKKKESEQPLELSIIFAMLLSSSLCFGIMAVSDIFVPIFFGPNYETCVSLLLILLPSCLFLAFANVVRTQYLLPHNMDKVYIVSAFIGAAINLLVNSLLIPRFGSVGAAIGTLIAEMAVCFYQCYHCRLYIPIKRYVRKVAPMIFNGFLMFIIIRYISFSINNNYILLFVKICLGAIIYISLTMCLLLFKKKDYEILIKSVRNIVNKKFLKRNL